MNNRTQLLTDVECNKNYVFHAYNMDIVLSAKYIECWM